MKLLCDIVQDLLPLYEDDLCSAASREAVEIHLRECAACKAKADRARTPLPEESVAPEDGAVVRSFRKLRRRWAASLIALVLVLPMLLLTVNQLRGSGVCYTNLDEIFSLWRYADALERSDYAAAADCMDCEKLYLEFQELLDMSLADYQQSYVSVTIGDSQWMTTEEFRERYLQDCEDPAAVWSYLIQNRIPVMVPEDVWDSLPEYTDTQDFVPLETAWGTYMVDPYSDLLENNSAVDVCVMLDLVPLEIYEEALPALTVSAESQYQYIQETFGPIRDMTLEEFCRQVRENYRTGLEALAARGYSLESGGFDDAYFDTESGAWSICWDVTATLGGTHYTFTLDARVRDGKLTIGAFYSCTASATPDEVLEALILTYLE